MNDDVLDSEYSDINRKAPRYSMNLGVEIISKGLNHTIAAKTANVSLNGLFACTELKAKNEEVFHVRVILKDKEAFFDVKAKVVWICDGKGGGHPKGLGLQFDQLTKDQRDIISKYLKDYVSIKLTTKT